MRLLAGALAAASLAIGCSSASAAVYCVPVLVSGCDYGRATLADAVTATNTSSDADTIMLGVGTFTGGVTANYETHIVGVTPVVTRIEGGTGTYGVRLLNASSSIQDVTIHEPAASPVTIGLLLSGDAQRVNVDLRDNPVNFSTAVLLQNDGSFTDGQALNSLTTSGADYGLSVSGSGDPLVSSVQAQGRYAITTAGAGNKRLRFIRAKGDLYGLQAQADSTLFEDSTVIGGPVVSYTGLGATTDIATTVRHLTVKGAYVGVESGHDGLTATMDVANTAVVGGGPDPETPDLYVVAYGTATGVLNASYSFFRDAHALKGMGGGTETIARGAGNIDGADAQLVDILADDLRPTWSSPLVDKGDPVPGGGEPMADLAGGDRTVNGVTDIGAYEYGRHAPTVTVTASPAAAVTGDPITFVANAADADQGEIPAVTWVFDDGSTDTGYVVKHAFTTPGAHVATATATDPTGLNATAQGPVTVEARVAPRPVLAPTLHFTKLRATKGIVRVKLSCPAVGADCSGVVRLLLAGKKAELGRATYRLPSGTSKTVRLHLTRAGRKRLHRARHGLRVKVIAKPAGGAAKSKTVRLSGR